MRSIEPNDSSNHIKREIHTQRKRSNPQAFFFSFRFVSFGHKFIWYFMLAILSPAKYSVFVIHKFALDSSCAPLYCIVGVCAIFCSYFGIYKFESEPWNAIQNGDVMKRKEHEACER